MKRLESNLNIFESLGVSENEINRISKEVGFHTRKIKKIKPKMMLELICEHSLTGALSLNDIASYINTLTGIKVSKQAVCDRISSNCVDFFQSILTLILKIKTNKYRKLLLQNGFDYDEVLIQDSTVIRIPIKLYDTFSGFKNATTKTCQIRIQVVYDLVHGVFKRFSIDPHKKNDLKAAPETELTNRTLTMRDRGYLTLPEIQRHKEVGADCIYMHKQRNKYIDIDSGEEIYLPKYLKKGQSIDKQVCLNNKERTIVRLIAIPVDEEIANLRRQRAKRQTANHKPSKDVLFLKDWSIYITTIDKDKASVEQIMNLYRLRWRIEIIFKAWKSCMSFSQMHNVSENQLKTLMIARLIMNTIFIQVLYGDLEIIIKNKYSKYLSLMKFINYITRNIQVICLLLKDFKKKTLSNSSLLDALSVYCCYCKRKRLNYCEMLEVFFLT